MKTMAFDDHGKNKSCAISKSISGPLLRWYGKNARALPWRVGPNALRSGARPDPYAVWLSEIMLQQTTVATVAPRYEEFLKRWPNVGALAAAPLEEVLGEWAGLGYYARARNLHKCAGVVAGLGGFPDTEEALRELPGIGGYTAAAIAAIAFNRRAVVVDGNIERIVARLFTIESPLPAAKGEIRNRAEEIWPAKRSGDFAQGLMDLGATVCRPKAPACLLCPLTESCAARAAGRPEAFPQKAAKKLKPTRRGAAFLLFNGKGEVLFERRVENGLLGGMLGLPGTEWTADLPGKTLTSAPVAAKWEKAGEARHTFTHFHLALDVYTARAPKGFRRSSDQQWIKPAAAKLPTVFRKAVDVSNIA